MTIQVSVPFPSAYPSVHVPVQVTASFALGFESQILQPLLSVIQCRLMIIDFGIDRIMFSIDYPFAPNAAGRKFLNNVALAPADKEKLAHGTADAVLKLKAGAK